jgi:Mrp family chromosome partitioning ATPase/capsular polysaccharide biosynthesis protein
MNETTDATAIFAPIWRRKWLILMVGVLVAAGTYFYYKRQPAHYQATTQVYLAAGSEQQLNEKGSGKSLSTNAGNQSALINSIVVESVHKQLRKAKDHVAKVAAHGKVKAKSAEKSEFVTITAEARTPKAAALLANTVAVAYIKRQHANYQRGVQQAIAIARRQLRRLETPRVAPAASKGKTGEKEKAAPANSTANVIQTANLNSKINQLEAQLAVTGVQQVKPAKPAAAVLLSPKPRKSAIFGFVIGIVLAAIAALGLSRFNRRLRSLADIEAVLQTQIMTALPLVRRPIVHRDGPGGSKFPSPSKFLLEPLRRFYTTLRLGNMLEQEQQASPRSILFLSADPGDGKSTIIANLALIQREAGERTAVIEADFRRPVQTRLLDLKGPAGLADVLSGNTPIEEAMQTVTATQAEALSGAAPAAGGVATAVEPRSLGAVSVLVGDTAVANPPVLLASAAMTELLRSCTEDFAHVLIDAPSPLEVSDVMPLLSAVDAIVIVARVGHTRENSAQRLQQLLMRTPSAPVLGVVANGVARSDIKKYGISSSQASPSWLGKLFGR